MPNKKKKITMNKLNLILKDAESKKNKLMKMDMILKSILNQK